MEFSPDVKNLNSALDSVASAGLCVLEEETASVPHVENDSRPASAPPPDLWTAILARVKSQVNPQSYATWFEPTHLASVGEGELVVEGPNQFFVDWLAEHHRDRLEDAAQEILGSRPRITFTVAANGLTAERIVRTPIERPPVRVESRAEADGLNPRYTFPEFVVGPNSRLTHAACLAVAEKPGRVYNPLFLYGGVGLGKTHLMHAIGSFVRGEHGMRVQYVTSEAFMNDMIWAIRQGKTFEFRNRYRNVEVLLIDDVQFMSGKGGTQEEFFHTFNHLYSAGKQIVIACDRPPKEINSLEERLLSRFESGLITDLAPPDFETRVAILRRKAETTAAGVPDDVLQRIARSVTSNIRELEGSLIRLTAFASLSGQPLNLHTAEEALQEFLRPQRREVRVANIQKIIASEFGISVEAMRSKSRTAKVTFPRQIAIYLAREMTGMPLVEIGKRFGGRDHSTVLHAYGKIAGMARQDSSLQERLEKMRRMLLF
jgi:chromosomal replication initiator protein